MTPDLETALATALHWIGACPDNPTYSCNHSEQARRLLAHPALAPFREALPTYAPHPGESHDFAAACRRCGVLGTVYVAILGRDEQARIEPVP